MDLAKAGDRCKELSFWGWHLSAVGLETGQTDWWCTTGPICLLTFLIKPSLVAGHFSSNVLATCASGRRNPRHVGIHPPQTRIVC